MSGTTETSEDPGMDEAVNTYYDSLGTDTSEEDTRMLPLIEEAIEQDKTDGIYTPDDPPEDDGAGNPNREAAKWRTRLREVEAERDGLRGQVEALNRASASRILGEKMTDPADFWNFHGEGIGDLLGDNGVIDPVKVETARDQLLRQKSYLGTGPRAPQPDPSLGAGHGSAPAAGWQQLVQGH